MLPGTPSFVGAPACVRKLSLRRPLPARRPVCARRPMRVAAKPMRMGLLPLLPNWVVLSAWLFGAYRFYLGFNRTSYQSSFRIPLALAWPVLFAVNASYRKNFTKSIKGSDDGF